MGNSDYFCSMTYDGYKHYGNEYLQLEWYGISKPGEEATTGSLALMGSPFPGVGPLQDLCCSRVGN